MANVSIKFNNKEYLLSCENGQEEHLEELSVKLNEKFNNLKNNLGNIGENKLLLITAITIIDEYFEIKKKIDHNKDELDVIKNKFLELKSLVYQYKKEKENQINEINNNQIQIKNKMESNLNEYNKILDTTTDHIEKIIKKANTDTQIQ
tara:strand:- start:723 stop:1169 length:447 start_codon:yes stop_codon:yes gene_type:complete